GLFGWWPLPIGNQGGYDPKAQLLPRGLLLLAPSRGNSRAAVEFTWRGLEVIVGNYYVLTLLVFIAATACTLVLTRRFRPERAQSAPEPDTARDRVLRPSVRRCVRAALPAAPRVDPAPAGDVGPGCGSRCEQSRSSSPGAGGALAGRAAHEVELVGDVDELARGQLPAALGQPVGQVRRFHLVLAIPQCVPDRVKDAAQEVSLVGRVVPVRGRVHDPVRRPRRQRGRPRIPQVVKQAAARAAFPGRPAVAKAVIHV